MWKGCVGMASCIGEMKGASCLCGGTLWGWCWEMGSGPVLMGIVPFLHPASFAMGQAACSQSPPALCPLPNEEGISILLQGVASYEGISCSQQLSLAASGWDGLWGF